MAQGDNSLGGIERAENIYEVDNKGVCGNCGTVASVVKHGHSDPEGGPFTGGDRVRCELSQAETADPSLTGREQ